MRTTLREKFVLWANGLAIALCLELLIRSHAGLASLQGLAMVSFTVIVMALLTTLVLRRAP